MKRVVAIGSLLLMTGTLHAADHKVVQKDKKFDKSEISIKAGDTIVFQNDEKEVTHNVFSLSGKNGFELKIQAPGAAGSVQFKDAGETEVECAIHPNMKLKVTVTK